MEDCGSIKEDFQMRPSGRTGSPTMVVMVDKSFKSPLFDGNGQSMDGTNEWEVVELQLRSHVATLASPLNNLTNFQF